MTIDVAGLCTVILVGGVGSRLHPVIGDGVPKPLACVQGRPFLWYLLDFLSWQGVHEVVLASGHRGDQIRQALSDVTPRHMRVRLCEEPRPLGTGGAVRYAQGHITSDPFLLMNGDSIILTSLTQLLAFHRKRQALASIVLKSVDHAARYGSVQLNEEGQIVSFLEKASKPGSALVNAGIYLVERRALATLPAEPCSLETDVLPRWVGHGLYGLVSTGPFIDIGTPESFGEAQTFFASWPPALEFTGGMTSARIDR